MEAEPNQDRDSEDVAPEKPQKGKPTTSGGAGADAARDAEAADSSATGDGPSGGAPPA